MLACLPVSAHVLALKSRIFLVSLFPLVFIFLILGVSLSLYSSSFVFIRRSYIHSCILIGVQKEHAFAWGNDCLNMFAI